MKKLLALTLASAMLLSMAACTKKPSEGAGSQANGSQASTSAATPLDPNQIVYDERTSEQLFEEAKLEKGDINVYTISSRTEKSCKAFNEDYPGLNAVAYDLDQNEAVEKMLTEAETGNVNCDVLHCKDTNGELFYNYTSGEHQILEAYYPKDICSHIDSKYLGYGMPFYAGLTFWYYNTEKHPDAQPINSWWDVTKPEWKGHILMENPIGNDTMMSLFVNLVLHADDMAANYKEVFGEDITYTNSLGLENAGYEFLYRLAGQNLTFMTGGDDIVAGVGTKGQQNDMLGICSAGKIDGAEENNLALAWALNLKPFMNVANLNYFYVAKGCDNPAGARLFIRYIMGEADGQGRGFDPYTKMGNWGLRDDRQNEKNPFTYEEAVNYGTIVNDVPAVNAVFNEVADTWQIMYDEVGGK